jgi:TonB family protein
MKYTILYLLLACTSVWGQTTVVQKGGAQVSNNSKDSVELKFTSDLLCNLYIDGELKGIVVFDAAPIKVSLIKGQYRIKAVWIEDTTMVWRETIEVKAEQLGSSIYKNIPMREFVARSKKGFATEDAPPLLPKPDSVYMIVRTAKEVHDQDAVVKNTGKVYTFVEVAPKFPGGDAGMFEFLSKNIVYPVHERDNDIQGKVLTRFIVNEDGSVSDVEVLRSVSPGLDKEAVRVIKMFPRFTPAMQGGVPVRVYFSLPVVFHMG